MASLPSQHPSLALHLTDRALNPILTSARSQPQLEALSSLTTTALTAHAAANRFSLGPAQRIIVEHGPGSPVVLASFLNGADALPNGGEASAAAAATTNNRASSSAPSRPVSSGVAAGATSIAESSAAASAGMGAIPDPGKPDEDEGSAAPMLVGVVAAATGEEAMEARRAAGRLERVGREFQREWAAEEGAGDALGDGQ
ncbi:uncharacterized protein LY79DRAFT_671806 [Colletotrichum navitas]|uniref:Uncharacterized protein n=1 Tax=Colletotrichum navitas TaxID=681940 RepID=A0AAD8V362_9PEZI|nr:uncharacterized protein LY79DRAFT_671806 [Colletotrichum navitas]KAK1580388.1 hypothetical protein LY79DRAFT_671806 [Colletotrichum navitas]